MPPTDMPNPINLDLFTVVGLIDHVRDIGGEPHYIHVDPETYRRIEPLTTIDEPFMLLGVPIVVDTSCPPHTLCVMQAPYERHEAPDDD